MFFFVSSRFLILSVVCIPVTGAQPPKRTICYQCLSMNGLNTLCDSPDLYLTSSCESMSCGKLVISEEGQVKLHRFCSSSSNTGCEKKQYEYGIYIESCFCDEGFCNKAEKFTWALFVYLSLVVSSLFAMF